MNPIHNVSRAVIACALLALARPNTARAAESGFEIPLGKSKVEFFSESGKPSAASPLLISLHRNENASFAAVRDLLRENPGRFVGIKTPGGRRLMLEGRGSIDPNRIFSKAGIEADLRTFSFYSPGIADEIGKFSVALLDKVDLKSGIKVIALHNNTDGGYSLTSYQKGGSESEAAAEVNLVPSLDPDDFILVTTSHSFKALKEAGFNVVLQDNKNAPDDGSLSVYCGKAGLDYFNIEADFGHTETQTKMLRTVYALGSRNPATPPSEAPAPVAKPIESGAVKLGDRPMNPTPPEMEELPGKRLPKPGIRILEPGKPAGQTPEAGRDRP